MTIIKSTVIVLLVLSCVLVNSSMVGCVFASSELWSQTYGGRDSDGARSVVETSDEGFAIAGYINAGSVGGPDVWLVKVDSNGRAEWNQTYGGEAYEYPYSLVEASDGGFAIAGYTRSFGAGSHDFWLVKTNAYGDMLWNRTYGGASDDRALSMVKTSDNGYALAGVTSSFGEGNDNLWLVKTDSDGNTEWNKTYGLGVAYSLVETSDNGYALAGNSRLVKTNSFGNLEWNQTFSEVMIYSVVETSDGGFALAGSTGDPPYFSFKLIKTDAYGTMLWNQTYNGGGEAYSMIQTSDRGYALTGYSYFKSVGDLDFWLVKTDLQGNMEWNQTYGGEYGEMAYSLVETSDGGYALAGITPSYGAGSLDAWLIKTDEYGVIPEFPSWTLLPLFLTATILVVLYRTLVKNNH